MNSPEDQIADTVLRDFQQMSSSRSNEESIWQEIAERLIPGHVGTFNSSQTYQPGRRGTEFIFDATPSIALGRFAAIVDSLLTPVNQKWSRITADNHYVNKDKQSRLWFDEASDILFKYRYAPKANFVSQNQQGFVSLGAYGNGVTFTDALSSEPGIRYKNIHLGEVHFAENHQGIIDKATRRFPFSVRQAYQKWGEKLPPKIIGKLKTNPEEKIFIIHCVKPREDLDPTRADYKGMAFASYYVIEDGKKLLSEGGYATFPYSISRYMQYPGEIYGRGPAQEVLPAIKTLYEQKKTVLKQGQRTVDPVLLFADDGIISEFSLSPGAMNPGGVTKDGRPLVHTLPVGNIMIGKELMDDERSAVNDAFLVRLFQLVMETPTMTATEVMERVREKGILLTPTVGRQQSEYLGPMIERELDLLVQQRLLPPMPPALLEAQGEYKIIYDSPLSRAARAEEASGLMRTVESTLNVVNVTGNMEPLDFFDWDTIVPEMSQIQGVPERFMRSKEVVESIRASRAEQAQMQQAIQAGPAAAAMIKATKA